jgi:hypothetical protein
MLMLMLMLMIVIEPLDEKMFAFKSECSSILVRPHSR